ncbi:MAG: PorP/SprF family type IX secretion system membrane protein [Flavobacterium sp.]|nr:PorP/SprF family type IX secretion system membrane protein [Flavobacterium sp.]
MKIKLISTILFLVFVIKAKAQDPIFTQYFMVPETLNPGFTGFMETENAGIMHRTQWPDLNLKIDTNYGFYNTWIESMNSGIGINVLSQRERFTSYNLTQVNVNYAYKVQLTDNWTFRPAISFGYGNKSFGFQDVVLADQININNNTISTKSIDPLILNDNIKFFDFSAGMLFNTDKFWVGGSLKHLNKPDISFMSQGNLPLEMFASATASYEFVLSDLFNLPLAYDTKLLLTSNYMHQGEFSRLDFGSGLVFNTFFVGVTAATNPSQTASSSQLLTSLNLFGGLRYEHFKFGYSYDINTTNIGRTGGIHELSLTYQLDLEARCFSCPNYTKNY